MSFRADATSPFSLQSQICRRNEGDETFYFPILPVCLCPVVVAARSVDVSLNRSSKYVQSGLHVPFLAGHDGLFLQGFGQQAGLAILLYCCVVSVLFFLGIEDSLPNGKEGVDDTVQYLAVFGGRHVRTVSLALLF